MDRRLALDTALRYHALIAISKPIGRMVAASLGRFLWIPSWAMDDVVRPPCEPETADPPAGLRVAGQHRLFLSSTMNSGSQGEPLLLVVPSY